MLSSISKHLEQHNRLLLKLHVHAFKAMVGSTLTIHDSAIFKKSDINGNHKISLSEFGETLKVLSPKTGEEELKRMMSELDTDDDGSVDINEFKVTFCGSGDNRELKDVYNKERNRKFSTSELHSVLKDIGENCSLKNCRRMIRSVDVDGYGFVDLKEVG